MIDCGATPTTFVEWDTAIVSSTAYTALPVTPSFDQSSAYIYVSFTYPDLPMTRFKPGDEITLVLTPPLFVGVNCVCRYIDIFQQLFQELRRTPLRIRLRFESELILG